MQKKQKELSAQALLPMGARGARAARTILHAAKPPGLGPDHAAAALGSLLLDHRGFARKLEAAYRKMWQKWCTSSV